MWFLIAIAAAADCPQTTDNVSFEIEIREATRALEEGDGDAFQDRMALIRLSLECMREPLRPSLAARFHRLWGIVDYTRGDEASSASHFLAARRLEPTERLPVYPESHDIQKTFASLQPSDVPGRLRRPDGQPHYVDGLAEGPIDGRASHVLQLGNDTGILDLMLLEPGELPPWAGKVEEAPDAPRKGRVLRLAGVGALGAAALALGGNVLLADRFGDASRDVDLDTLQKERSRTNLLGGLAVGLAVTGGGLVTAGMVVR